MTGQQSDTLFKYESLEQHSVPVKPGAKAARPKVTRRVRLAGVQVEQEDIAKGIRANSHACMISDAIKRQVPGVKNVETDVQTIRWIDTVNHRRVVCLTPPECQMALVRFDRGVPPPPFKFNLQSVQVTSMRVYRPKLDADGNPVKVMVRGGRPLKDGSKRVYETNAREVVSEPSVRKEYSNNHPSGSPSGDHFVGGKLPPHHMPSFKRKFGMKAFTWDDHEDENSILARHVAAGLPLTDDNPSE